ncbi:hypothetical protein HDV05_002373, partial [Chytridiales sp. JEL 0842]
GPSSAPNAPQNLSTKLSPDRSNLPPSPTRIITTAASLMPPATLDVGGGSDSEDEALTRPVRKGGLSAIKSIQQTSKSSSGHDRESSANSALSMESMGSVSGFEKGSAFKPSIPATQILIKQQPASATSSNQQGTRTQTSNTPRLFEDEGDDLSIDDLQHTPSYKVESAAGFRAGARADPGAGDAFLEELDSQMAEIDEFLNTSKSVTSPVGGKGKGV